jgi:phospho-N-acetylmuramoyl-pentapeptide-transferase
VLEPPGVPCYTASDPLDLAIFAAACAGATFGFLWWNTSPASIFMGDTGSLAIGGAVAALAIMSRTELLLILLAGMYLVITISVILQVGSFKLTGKRVFRMAPLHHHFELLGWPEILIVVRFWIIHGLLVGTGLTVFYAEWVTA